MVQPTGGAPISHTQETIADLGFEKVEHDTFQAGRGEYHHFKVSFGQGKDIDLIMPPGHKMESMLQLIHTLGKQTQHLTPEQFKKFKEDRSIEQIRFGVDDKGDGSFEMRLYKASLNNKDLFFLFPNQKDLIKLSKEDQEGIKRYAEGLEARNAPPLGAAPNQAGQGSGSDTQFRINAVSPTN
ncbi:MAG: hypothetical protein KBC64_02010 [Simkaniaceae bacterium]|nr:hypothetical protein [Simkaniaceae bacterium]